MGADSIGPLILEYRYWILIPLSIVEGPVVAFVAGTFSSLGYFNIYVLMILFFARDMIMDAFYYALGYHGGRTKTAQKLLKKIGIEESHLEDIRELWEKHPGKTMFLGKLSYGIASSFIVLAGTVRMPLKKFFGWGALVAIIQFWGLLFLGYFFGESFGDISNVIDNIHYVILGITIIGIVYYIFSRYMRKEFTKEVGGTE
jgi:membrane-associated protein